MRPKSVHVPPPSGLYAWVLGPRITARRIGEGLLSEGFEVRYPELGPEGKLPSAHEPDAIQHVRTRLAGWLREARAEAGEILPFLHPGSSPWATRAELVLLGQELGFTVLAPSPRTINLFSNRLNFLAEADRLGIPNLVLSFDPLSSAREVERIARNSSRFILKSVRENPNGMGILPILEKAHLEKNFPIWIDLLRSQLGEAMFFAESYLEQARQVVLPFARFEDGFTHFFQSVDGSLQSQHRKILQLSPSPAIDPEIEKEIHGYARLMLDETGYVGVGSLEFLLDGDRIYLIEGHPRVGRATRIWEETSGTRIASWQLAAAGARSSRPTMGGSRKFPISLSLAIHAEDPLLQLPQPGWIAEVGEERKWSILGAEAELELAVDAGDTVTDEGDGWLGQLWLGAQSMTQAFQFAEQVLKKTWIAGGIQTNERFLLELVTHPWVKEGMFHAGFVDEEFIPKGRMPERFHPLFEELAGFFGGQKDTPCRWIAGDERVEPKKRESKWVRGPEHFIVPGGGARISGIWQDSEGNAHRVCAAPAGEERWQVRIGEWCVPLRKFSAGASKRLTALVSGRIRSLYFREGSKVPAQEPVCLIESLGKMVPLALPVPVTLRRWLVEPRERVRIGQVIAELER